MYSPGQSFAHTHTHAHTRRSRVWSEPTMVDAGAFEFADTAKYLGVCALGNLCLNSECSLQQWVFFESASVFCNSECTLQQWVYFTTVSVLCNSCVYFATVSVLCNSECTLQQWVFFTTVSVLCNSECSLQQWVYFATVSVLCNSCVCLYNCTYTRAHTRMHTHTRIHTDIRPQTFWIQFRTLQLPLSIHRNPRIQESEKSESNSNLPFPSVAEYPIASYIWDGSVGPKFLS